MTLTMTATAAGNYEVAHGPFTVLQQRDPALFHKQFARLDDAVVAYCALDFHYRPALTDATGEALVYTDWIEDGSTLVNVCSTPAVQSIVQVVDGLSFEPKCERIAQALTRAVSVAERDAHAAPAD